MLGRSILWTLSVSFIIGESLFCGDYIFVLFIILVQGYLKCFIGYSPVVLGTPGVCWFLFQPEILVQLFAELWL